MAVYSTSLVDIRDVAKVAPQKDDSFHSLDGDIHHKDYIDGNITDGKDAFLNHKSYISCYDYDEFANELTPTPVDLDESQVDVGIVSLDDMSMELQSNHRFPARMITRNKGFLSTYLKYEMPDMWKESTLMADSIIVPNQLEQFKQANNSSQSDYHVVQPIDPLAPVTKPNQTKPFVTNRVRRVTRAIEQQGPLMVTTFLKEQTTFQGKRFSLVYPVVVLLEKEEVYLCTQPSIRTCMRQVKPTIDEYDMSSVIPEKFRHPVLQQRDDVNIAFDAEMEDRLIGLDQKRKEGSNARSATPSWHQHQREHVFQIVGKLACELSRRIVVPVDHHCDETAVVFGVNVVLDSHMRARVVDIDGKCSLPNIVVSKELVSLAMDRTHYCKHFARISIDNRIEEKRRRDNWTWYSKAELAQMKADFS